MTSFSHLRLACSVLYDCLGVMNQYMHPYKSIYPSTQLSTFTTHPTIHPWVRPFPEELLDLVCFLTLRLWRKKASRYLNAVSLRSWDEERKQRCCRGLQQLAKEISVMLQHCQCLRKVRCLSTSAMAEAQSSCKDTQVLVANCIVEVLVLLFLLLIVYYQTLWKYFDVMVVLIENHPPIHPPCHFHHPTIHQLTHYMPYRSIHPTDPSIYSYIHWHNCPNCRVR